MIFNLIGQVFLVTYFAIVANAMTHFFKVIIGNPNYNDFGSRMIFSFFGKWVHENFKRLEDDKPIDQVFINPFKIFVCSVCLNVWMCLIVFISLMLTAYLQGEFNWFYLFWLIPFISVSNFLLNVQIR